MFKFIASFLLLSSTLLAHPDESYNQVIPEEYLAKVIYITVSETLHDVEIANRDDWDDVRGEHQSYWIYVGLLIEGKAYEGIIYQRNPENNPYDPTLEAPRFLREGDPEILFSYKEYENGEHLPCLTDLEGKEELFLCCDLQEIPQRGYTLCKR